MQTKRGSIHSNSGSIQTKPGSIQTKRGSKLLEPGSIQSGGDQSSMFGINSVPTRAKTGNVNAKPRRMQPWESKNAERSTRGGHERQRTEQ